MDVPVQFFQSVIAVELAVAGALLWQLRYFESSNKTRRDGERVPDSRLRLGLALVLGTTLFGSLWAIADEGPKWAALAVTLGLAVSLTPILLRVLPRSRGACGTGDGGLLGAEAIEVASGRLASARHVVRLGRQRRLAQGPYRWGELGHG